MKQCYLRTAELFCCSTVTVLPTAVRGRNRTAMSDKVGIISDTHDNELHAEIVEA